MIWWDAERIDSWSGQSLNLTRMVGIPPKKGIGDTEKTSLPYIDPPELAITEIRGFLVFLAFV